MKYLCLLHYDVAKFETISASRMEAIVKECTPYDAALKASGQLVVQGSLQHGSAMILRPRDGKTTTSEGTLASTVGAVLVLEARDLNDAVRVASLHPAARTGEDLGWAVEVRPLEMFEYRA
ncbi:YciI family protein [Myxococcus stipitatus]|uniref:YciI family protein n=1 Tax=Myxococcus stipitatus TaxID=83455 RepID=UPI0030CF20B0